MEKFYFFGYIMIQLIQAIKKHTGFDFSCEYKHEMPIGSVLYTSKLDKEGNVKINTIQVIDAAAAIFLSMINISEEIQKREKFSTSIGYLLYVTYQDLMYEIMMKKYNLQQDITKEYVRKGNSTVFDSIETIENFWSKQ